MTTVKNGPARSPEAQRQRLAWQAKKASDCFNSTISRASLTIKGVDKNTGREVLETFIFDTDFPGGIPYELYEFLNSYGARMVGEKLEIPEPVKIK